MIKAAQNAEWKVHGWKLGKPPTIVYEGIGFDPKAPVGGTTTPPQSVTGGLQPLTADALKGMELTPPPAGKRVTKGKPEDARLDVPRPSNVSIAGRSSMGAWSDFDDLADFEGRFGSSTTLATVPPVPPLPNGVQAAPVAKRKASKGFFGILKSPPAASGSSAQNGSPSGSTVNVKSPPKLKGLRSMGSLKGKLTGSKSSPANEKPITPKLEANMDSFGSGLGIDVESVSPVSTGIAEWGRNVALSSSTTSHKQENSESRPGSPWSGESHTFPKARRSFSLNAAAAPGSILPTTPPPPIHRPKSSPARPLSGDSGAFSISSHHHTPPRVGVTTTAPTSSVATALLRASHKEAQKGLANDLLSILERDSKPWGFSYTDVRQKVKIWYGDKDEKIGESGIRWMERVMKDCELKICKGKDHSLMTCADVVVEALESLQEELKEGELLFLSLFSVY